MLNVAGVNTRLVKMSYIVYLFILIYAFKGVFVEVEALKERAVSASVRI